MSSSASSKNNDKKKSRAGPPVENQQLRDLKKNQRAEQQARTRARVAELQLPGPDRIQDLYQVGRANVLAAELDAEIQAALSEPPVIDLSDPDPTGPDLSSIAGCWSGERRPNGLVLTRGDGELLLISESTVRPGEWHIKYDAPFPEGTNLNPE